MGISHRRFDVGVSEKLALSGPRHPCQVLHSFGELFKRLEDELGVDPVVVLVLPRHIDHIPVLAVGDAVVVVDLHEVVNQFVLFFHILIPCFGCRSRDR